MASPRREAAGFTLVEVMVAMAVMVIGSLGALSLQRMGVQLNADARITTRASALAQDLVNQMQTWSYTDSRLANSQSTNDGTLANPTYGDPTVAIDHTETDLASGTWNGVPTADAQALGFTRTWNVAELDYDGNGNLTGRRVAVIVRWQQNGSERQVVLLTFLRNPSVT